MSDEDDLTPAEARVREVLGELRGEGDPEPAGGLRERVTSTLRWQRPVRGALVSFGTLASAVADGVRALVGGRRP